MSALPPGVAWLVRRVAPRRRAAELVRDLDEDYADVRRRQSRARARWWLTREAASLLAAYLAAPLARLPDQIPILTRDLRLVGRGLRRGALPAAGAAAMLSTGLLALLLTAGLAQTLLFREVSATHGEALRRIAVQEREGGSRLRLAYPELQVIREHLADAAEVTAVNMQPVVLRTLGTDLQTMAEVVDGRYFAVTGTRTIIGRGLLGADDQAAAPPVAVISEPFWRSRFDAAPTALGRTVELNRQPYTVVGVSRALGSSSFLGASVDAWITSAHADAVLNPGWRTDLDNRWFTAFALPARGLAEVQGRLDAAAADLARRHPESWRERRLQTAAATVLTGNQRTIVGRLAGILAGLGLLILATAASNVGGVLLARAAGARRHVAIHLSMGSGRTAIVRRQVLEGAALGLAGAALAVAVYVWARAQLAEIALLPTLALRLDLPLDLPLVALVVVAGMAAGMLLALGPALWAARTDLSDAMRAGDVRAGGGTAVSRLRRLLVAAQVGLSLALVVGAALFTQSLMALADSDLGFSRGGLVAMDFDREPSGLSADERAALAREALRRAEATPGVRRAAMSSRAPVDPSTPGVQVRASTETGWVGDVSFYLATSGYFETIGLPILRGRAFSEQEGADGAAVVIVNETLAARLWPGGDALDRLLYVSAPEAALRVIGVARDSKYRSLSDPPRPHLYRPTPPALGLALLARTAGDPHAALGGLQAGLDEVGPGLVGFFPRTLDDHLAIDLLPTRAAAAAAALLGVVALLLSAVGLFGLVSWFVELRRREIGVRMALGARAGDVRRLVVRQTLATTVPGVIAGMLLSVGLGLLARTALYGVGPLDPIALAAGIAALAVVVLAASYVPSRRATRIDPIRALRDA